MSRRVALLAGELVAVLALLVCFQFGPASPIRTGGPDPEFESPSGPPVLHFLDSRDLLDPSPIERFIDRGLRAGSGAFVVPSPVRRGEPVEVVLDIGPSDVSWRDVRRQVGGLDVGAARLIEIPTRIVASLTADRDCSIVPKTSLDQAVFSGEHVIWRWAVTPRMGGRTVLTVTLSAPLPFEFPGHETPEPVLTVARAVTVTVTNADRLSDVWSWLGDYWLLVGAGFGAVAAAWEWLQRRRRRRTGF